MIEEVWVRVFVVSATLAGAFVTSGALITWSKRPWPDWVMAAGAGLTTIGLAMTTLVAFDLSEWLQRHGEYPCLGSICLGAMMFSMGFVIDQIRHRAIHHHQLQIGLMDQAPEIFGREEGREDHE